MIQALAAVSEARVEQVPELLLTGVAKTGVTTSTRLRDRRASTRRIRCRNRRRPGLPDRQKNKKCANPFCASGSPRRQQKPEIINPMGTPAVAASDKAGSPQ